MRPQEILEITAKFLHIEAEDILAHRISYTERVVIVVAGAGRKFSVGFEDLGMNDEEIKEQAVAAVREATTIAGPPDPKISPVELQPLFILFESHLTRAAMNALREAGLLNAAKLRKTSDEELLAIPGIGQKTVETIREIQEQAI